MTDSQTLTRRASQRLHELLSELGYPLDAFLRITSLAERLKQSTQASSNLLSGVVPWTLDDVAHLAKKFARTPGFFLDPQVGPRLPSDVQIVHSEDGGEPIAWRAPSGFLSRKMPIDSQLSYINTVSAGYFSNGLVRTKLVFHDWVRSKGEDVCFPNEGYILSSDAGGVVPMRCIAADRATGSFLTPTDPTSVPVRVDFSKKRVNVASTFSVVGRVIGTVQGF